ncbi:MAG: hypothetical protein II935_04215 [Bacteroidales bacterium]|nr:hypothetical protein [Bacteroidales bacterium]
MNTTIVECWAQVATVVTCVTTAVYTIATILICRANKKSADAATEQAKSMQLQTAELLRQYNESTRARIAIRYGWDNAVGKYLSFKNIGKRDADNVQVFVCPEFLDALENVSKGSCLTTLTQSCIHIAAGQEFPVFVGFASRIEMMPVRIAKIRVSYTDKGELCEDSATIDFTQYGFLSTCRNMRTVDGKRIEEDVVLKG